MSSTAPGTGDSCLSSRFPYGNKITRGKLTAVGEAEIFLRGLGVRQLRVRHHDQVARIEVAEEDMKLLLQNREQIPEIASRCAVFAKTDLIHAQQQGFSLGAICDSLCKGLADNIVDTLFNKVDPIAPVVMTGGVSLNQAVIKHIEELLGTSIIVHEFSHLMASLGAIYQLMEDPELSSANIDVGNILVSSTQQKDYYYSPLSGSGNSYPDFSAHTHYRFQPEAVSHASEVQVDLYEDPAVLQTNAHYEPAETELILGIDVGSTSTKSILLSLEGTPIAGCYTYTSGQPLKAVKAIFESIDDLQKRLNQHFSIRSCGTTGSGRKFIGKIIRADRIYDEITAHARAAYELNPATDTIIEIGGQDAKFTLMKDGVVTFSHMNTVCAAGTGSFIEELAGKMGVPLSDYSRRCQNTAAPLASDRCTVFMERDINQLLNSRYSVDEVLTTVLHSVRENYLKKVANEAQIGTQVCFQGATAKNRSLVSAFEQRLGQSIYVSRYCHLTGALGTALILNEEFHGETQFRGINLFRKDIPISTETCELCLNHCLISKAPINGETVAYGFLCGRDYETKKYVDAGQSGFDLMKFRKGLLSDIKVEKPQRRTRIGIPATLHMKDDLSFWKDFF